MLILNFTHPLTDEQRAQIKSKVKTSVAEVRDIPVRINERKRLGPQIISIVDTVGLTSQEWQTLPLLINPPGYAPAAFVLLAELHGRIGHFPSLICCVQNQVLFQAMKSLKCLICDPFGGEGVTNNSHLRSHRTP